MSVGNYALLALVVGLVCAIIGAHWKASFWRSMGLLILGLVLVAVGGGVLLAAWVMSA